MEVSERIISNRLSEGTRKQYESKVKNFIKWLKENYPNITDGEEINLEFVTADVFKEFFGYICQKHKNIKKVSSDGIAYQSFQHVSGYKSALKYLYTSFNAKFPEDIDMILKQFFEGYERKIAKLKQNGEMSMSEGKNPITLEAFYYLARKSFFSEKDFNLNSFAHCFLILCWNLISRCSSVAGLMFEHISWKEDALVIVFPQHKGDQEGKTALPKHVYANPSDPLICPILSLGIFLFSSGFRRQGSKNTVFGGEKDDAETRFSNWFTSRCKESETELLSMGLPISELGTHSFRKGIATYLSGINGGPNGISIFLRAGWSLGNVQNRYIFEGQGGDQLCGRAACGLSILDTNFSVLPPHFNQSDDPILQPEEWEEIVPGYATFFCAKFRQVIPFLLASILYHRNFLFQNLPKEHPIFLQRFWNPKFLSRLLPKLETGIGKNETTKMSATGIPPNILLANEISKVKSDLIRIEQDIQFSLDKLPETIKRNMLDNFQINGALPISHQEVSQMLATLQKNIIDAVKQEQIAQVNSSAIIENIEVPSSYAQFTWNERLHPVPSSFRFPKCNCKCLWDLWWGGKVIDNYGPYRRLEPFDMNVKSDRVLLSKARFVMNHLISIIQGRILDISNKTNQERDLIFEQAFLSAFKRLDPERTVEELDKKRIGEMSYLTFYDLLKKASP